jgi:hypothetical protein
MTLAPPHTISTSKNYVWPLSIIGKHIRVLSRREECDV